MLRRSLAYIFVFFIIFSCLQCASKGSPTGGPKDVTPPVLTKAEPENMTTNFKAEKIRLYFDELVKLKDVQEQLIVSPPLKNQPTLTPQGSASKYVEIILKDTLLENTTYTLNFGQSIVDNNEENPNSFFTYVLSTGDYIDSLELKGVVKDAFNKKADDFISVMLYSIDSTYTDSTIYKKPPNYITNTLDSTIIFHLKNLKEGKYALFALKDESKNYMFDQKSDKIGFIRDTVNLPTDSIYLLTLFKEVPNYSVTVPSLVSKNKISFGYYGNSEEISIRPISKIPDTVKTTILKERDKDTLNFWFTPYEMDSIVFAVANENLKAVDTFIVKNRKVGIDSLKLSPIQKNTLDFEDKVSIIANTPLVSLDSSLIDIMNKDSLKVNYDVALDSIKNQLDFDFKVEPNQVYQIQLLPGAVLDFFGTTNDTINYSLATKSYADYGDLTVTLSGKNINYPVIVQLTNDKEELQREIFANEQQLFEFNNLPPGNYMIRVIFDRNKNLKWDTGNYLKKIQPEKVAHYPNIIEMRANWIENVTFNILD